MFFTKFAPPNCKQVKAALKKMGFEPEKQGSTLHEHWTKIENGRIYKVTVDCPKEPFDKELLKSMAKQAGVSSVKEFLLYCHDKNYGKKAKK